MGNSIITKPIVGYEDKYEVDSEGVVWSINYKRLGFRKPLVPVPNGHGYLQVGLSRKSRAKRFMVHRLVADSFLENHGNKAEVNHKNGVKSDNRLLNLEWSTSKENKEHYLTALGGKMRVDHSQKLKADDVRKIRRYKGILGQNKLAAMFGVSDTTIGKIHNDKIWKGVL